MRSIPFRTSGGIPRAVRLALGVALGAAAGADTAFAIDVVPIGGDPAGASTVGAPALAAKRAPSKLTFGLDTLAAEYQAYQEAVASGAAAPGTFTTRTMAQVVDGDSVVIDAVAADDPQALKAALEAHGAEVAAVAGRIVSARVPLGQLRALNDIGALKFARLAVAATRTGSVTSQGDAGQRSDLARSNFGVNGAGSTVGVLSDSFDCSGNGSYAADVGSGDLPAGVNVIDDTASSCSDEGRAMAQIVYDVAPGASLAFHTAYNGEADFAQGILDLASAGATIIVDDVYYLAEPMFQDGVIAQAVDQVDAAGASYFSSAGNSGRHAYEAPFDGSGQTGLWGELHDFDPGAGVDTRLTIHQDSDTTYIMQWQDPFYSVSGAPGAANDLDICFYSPVGATAPFYCSAYANTGDDPLEGAGITGTGDLEIAIEKYSGPDDPDPVKVIMYGSVSFPEAYAGTEAGTVSGHTNAAGANSVGASAYFLTPAFGEDPPVLNYYSSAGNTPILFTTAGAPVYDIREKPEFTAPDGGNNTFFGGDWEPDGWPNFFGTSAAAPHAAAVAALMRELDPALTPTEIRTSLQDTAVDMLQRETGGFGGPRVNIGAGYDNDSGSGLIDADAALASLTSSCPTDLVIDSETYTPGTYVVQASNSITIMGTTTVQTGADLTLEAGNHIGIRTGFRVKSGAVLAATIGTTCI